MDFHNSFGSSQGTKKAVLGLLVFVNLMLFCLILYALLPRNKAVLNPDLDYIAGGADDREDDESEDTENPGNETSEDLDTVGSEDKQEKEDAGAVGAGNQASEYANEEKNNEMSTSESEVFASENAAPAIRNIQYTVRCIDEDGEVFQQKVYKGEVGSSVSVTAPVFTGLLPMPEKQEKTLLSDEEGNVFDFYYEEEHRQEEEIKTDIPAQNVLHYNGHTYFAYRTKRIDSYWEAAEYAESCGGYLAVITDSAENRAVYDYVFEEFGYESAYFGLTDDGSENDWYWIDGSIYDYDNFAKGQPDNRGGNENYALFWYGDRAYTWNDGDFGRDAAGTVTFLIEWDTQ